MNKTTEHAKSLRRNQTEAEKKLWYHLRNRQLGDYKFRRQHPFPPYILDFFCEDLNLAIELDGGQHTTEKDKTRTDFLEDKNITILRYWNNDIIENIEGVLEDIKNKIDTPHPTTAISLRSKLPYPSPSGRGGNPREAWEGEGNKPSCPKACTRVCIAKIATAHGIKGFVKLHVFADDPQLANGKLFTSESGDNTLSLKLKNATAKHWLAEIEGITDRTAAEKLRGTELYIDKSDLPTPDPDKFYIANLIGMMCVDTDSKEIGKVFAVENFGASDLLEIKPETGESFYLPFTDDTILDIGESNITIQIPEGLLE